MLRTTEAGYRLIAYTKSYLSLKSGGPVVVFLPSIYFSFTHHSAHTHTNTSELYTQSSGVSLGIKSHYISPLVNYLSMLLTEHSYLAISEALDT